MSIYGNLKYDFTFPASNPSGSLILIKSITASASSSLSFVNGSNDVVLDSTYKAYKFVYKNMHPSNSTDAQWQFQGSTNTGSTFATSMTTTNFRAYHFENDAGVALQSRSSDAEDGQSNDTNYQTIGYQGGAVADENCSGELWLYNPSSTTYVKHFLSTNGLMGYDSGNGGFQQNTYVAGYFNTTSAIDGISFKFATGNIDDGTISLYGLA